ncbi:MAG: dTDP-4-dehydrorhamnose reductase [Syntrophales bacterium]|nr:dTDP-4-dehydrorhamnose reductase [Syntrophales bacterium]
MRILILGHAGMLGSDLFLRLSASHDVTGKDIDDFDITSAVACHDVISEARPEIVINAAAYTDVDGCESNRQRCFSVNANGVKNVVLACKGIKVVHFSTDYVFDGQKGIPYQEDDLCHPVNTYGQSKLEGELFLKAFSHNFLLIRTAWLYGINGRNFVKTIAEAAKTSKTIDVVDDQIGSPTYTWDLAAAVQQLIEGHHTGVFHVTNMGCCSWYEFAVKILECISRKDVEVRPIKSDQLTRPASRPSCSVLSCEKFQKVTGKAMRHWQIALCDYISRVSEVEPHPHYINLDTSH